MSNNTAQLLICIICYFCIVLPVEAYERKLPEDWFSRYSSSKLSHANLSGPVKEVWRCPRECRIVTDGKAFFSSVFKSDILCKDITTGEDLWKFELASDSNKRTSGGIVAVFGGMAFLHTTDPTKNLAVNRESRTPANGQLRRTKRSIVILDTENGKIIRSFPPQDFPANDPEKWARLRRLAKTPSLILAAALERKDEVLSTFYASGGPTYPISANLNEWTYKDADSLLNLVNCRFLPTNGVGKHVIIAGRSDMVHLDLITSTLSRINPSTGKTYWEVTAFAGGRGILLWHPPFIVLFSQYNAIIAYDLETGRPVWRYEWPYGDETYSRSMRALNDGILLFTDPLTKREPTTVKDPDTGMTIVTRSNRYLGLIKLDMKGQLVFEQELDLDADDCEYYLFNDHVIITKDRMTVCYKSTGSPSITQRKGRHLLDKASQEQIQSLHAEYKTGSCFSRAVICSKLGKLGDKSIYERVILDLRNASPREKPDYVKALGWLGDKRAIPTLIELLNDQDGNVKSEARFALSKVLPGHLSAPAYEKWQKWWPTHKHLFERNITSESNGTSLTVGP